MKELKREADHSPLSRTEVWNVLSFTATPPTRLRSVVKYEDTFSFCKGKQTSRVVTPVCVCVCLTHLLIFEVSDRFS